MDDEAFGKPCNPKPAVVDLGLLSINRVQTPGTPNAMLQATPKRLNTTEKKNRKKTAESVAQTNNVYNNSIPYNLLYLSALAQFSNKLIKFQIKKLNVKCQKYFRILIFDIFYLFFISVTTR